MNGIDGVDSVVKLTKEIGGILEVVTEDSTVRVTDVEKVSWACAQGKDMKK